MTRQPHLFFSFFRFCSFFGLVIFRFWRAQILYVCPAPAGRVLELEFINHLKKGGLFIIGDILLPQPDLSQV